MKNTMILMFLVLGLAFSAAPTDECISDPFNKTCVDFQLNKTWIEEELKMWCTPGGHMAMPDMTSCTVRSHCQTDATAHHSEYCLPFALYKAACTEMPRMCASVYGKLCQNGSVVEECKVKILPIPSSDALYNFTYDICITQKMFGMKGCSKCWTQEGVQKECEVFQIYSDLCLAMPNMGDCSIWSSLCKLIPSWSLCPDGSHIPSMEMFFHFGIYDYILFKEWVPQTMVSYLIAVFGTLFLSIISEGVKALRQRMETKWRHQLREKIANHSRESDLNPLIVEKDSPKLVRQPYVFIIELQKGLFRLVEVFLHYILMLIAMTFNVGLFLAVIVGAGVGSMLWAPLQVMEIVPTSEVQGEDCH